MASTGMGADRTSAMVSDGAALAPARARVEVEVEFEVDQGLNYGVVV